MKRSEIFIIKQASKHIKGPRAATTFLFSFLITAVMVISRGLVMGIDGGGSILKGVYDYAVYQGSAQPLFSERYNFEVSTKDCSWIINYENASALTNAEILDVKTTASCDGKSIYVVQLQSQMADKAAWGDRYDSVKDRLPAAMAHIYSGDYPPPKESTLQNIWRAFASSCVLAERQGKAKPPFLVDMAVFSDTNYYCDFHWMTNEVEPHLPTLILTSGDTFYARNPKTGELVRGKYPPPYDKGYTVGVGHWLKATNIDGFSVPIDFEFTAFSPRSKGTNSADLLRAFTYRCKVTSIESAKTTQIPTELSKGKVRISDRRFMNRGQVYITYEAIDGKWPNPNDSYLQRHLATAPKISLEDEALAELGIKPIGAAFSKTRITHTRVNVTRIVIYLLAALPIVFFVRKKLFNKK
jgi:hypothetical protein